MGEVAAAKRLFKGVEDVGGGEEDHACSELDASGVQVGMGFGYDGLCESGVGEEGCARAEEEFKTSSWAGRRLVTDWNQFLKSCEREGVARF